MVSITTEVVHKLGYSPCPNDCFIFYALTQGKIMLELPRNIKWEVILDDVEVLNQLALANKLAITKVSYHAYGHLVDKYVMLRSGGALGKGVGPLIVSKEHIKSLAGEKVAIPGGLTTANLLLKLALPNVEAVPYRYDQIMSAVSKGEVLAGLIIHESRFTYKEYGLKKYLDLGKWWEEETGLLIPLGGIIAKRSLGSNFLLALEKSIQKSLHYSYTHLEEVYGYVAKHAQEMSKAVQQKHIDLYVNKYSVDVGAIGEKSVKELFARAQAKNLLPQNDNPLFFSANV